MVFLVETRATGAMWNQLWKWVTWAVASLEAAVGSGAVTIMPSIFRRKYKLPWLTQLRGRYDLCQQSKTLLEPVEARKMSQIQSQNRLKNSLGRSPMRTWPIPTKNNLNTWMMSAKRPMNNLKKNMSVWRALQRRRKTLAISRYVSTMPALRYQRKAISVSWCLPKIVLIWPRVKAISSIETQWRI